MDEGRLRLGEALIAAGAITPELLQEALEIQQRSGARLGEILLARGYVTRRQLYRALSQVWGIPYIELDKTTPDPQLAQQFDPEIIAKFRFFPLHQTEEAVTVAVAEPPGPEIEAQIRAVLGDKPIHFLATTQWDIERALLTFFRGHLLDKATFGLFQRAPQESAYTTLTRNQYLVFVGILLILVSCLFFQTKLALILLNLIVNVSFLVGILFKFVVSLAGAKIETKEPVTRQEVEALRDEELPRYTILVPVYQEANIIAKLLDNLLSLDYPPEKLEILLLMEENDEETIAAAKAARPPNLITFVIIPDAQPKTKPKACNVGLFLASGDYLVIYDAEDRPEPDQLKKAVVAFKKGEESLVCVQAALNYFNAYENFLTKMFTLEYSYWFDYMLPGLDRLRLPIPLGGTSNHFRTQILRQLGGWDPFNVTEDADLGIRAAAHGYTVGIVNSTTYEEANSRVYNWIRQRSRWVKGYMQTTLVHFRHPRRLARQLGWRGSLGFLLLVGGTPVIFLSNVIMWFIFTSWAFLSVHAFAFLFPMGILYIGLANFLIGNGLMIYLNMLAVVKRRFYRLLPYALLNPIYWILHSLAAYKALVQLVTRPHYWEKTFHGITQYTDGTTPP